mgnify:FL=1
MRPGEALRTRAQAQQIGPGHTTPEQQPAPTVGDPAIQAGRDIVECRSRKNFVT